MRNVARGLHPGRGDGVGSERAPPSHQATLAVHADATANSSTRLRIDSGSNFGEGDIQAQRLAFGRARADAMRDEAAMLVQRRRASTRSPDRPSGDAASARSSSPTAATTARLDPLQALNASDRATVARRATRRALVELGLLATARRTSTSSTHPQDKSGWR